jgi:hypothetical protein
MLVPAIILIPLVIPNSPSLPKTVLDPGDLWQSLAIYLYLYTILPRVRSYGESSTATLSPGKMRMKFFRILPDTCAST